MPQHEQLGRLALGHGGVRWQELGLGSDCREQPASRCSARGEVMADYTADDAKQDLDLLRSQGSGLAVDRLGGYVERLEARALAAERVCEAAVEVIAPSVKGDPMQQRQTRYLRALAEWREARK